MPAGFRSRAIALRRPLEHEGWKTAPAGIHSSWLGNPALRDASAVGVGGGCGFDRLSAVDAGRRPALQDVSAAGRGEGIPFRGALVPRVRACRPGARSPWATLFPPGELKAALPVPSVRGQRVEQELGHVRSRDRLRERAVGGEDPVPAGSRFLIQRRRPHEHVGDAGLLADPCIRAVIVGKTRLPPMRHNNCFTIQDVPPQPMLETNMLFGGVGC